MDVEMGHRLPASLPIGLEDSEPLGADRSLHGAGDPCCRLEADRRQLGAQIDDRLEMWLDGDDHVARIHLTNIHEGDGLRVFVHTVRRNLARHNLTKDAIDQGRSPAPAQRPGWSSGRERPRSLTTSTGVLSWLPSSATAACLLRRTVAWPSPVRCRTHTEVSRRTSSTASTISANRVVIGSPSSVLLESHSPRVACTSPDVRGTWDRT